MVQRGSSMVAGPQDADELVAPRKETQVSSHLSPNPSHAVDTLAAFALSRVASGAIDPTTWAVIWTNPALENLLGDDVATSDLAVEDLLAPEVTVRQVASLAAVASGKLAGMASDTTLLRRDGSRFSGHLTVGMMGDGAERILFFQIVPEVGLTEAPAAPAAARRRLEQAVEAVSRDETTSAVLLLATIEGLDDIDEQLGYEHGDLVVAEIERRLQGAVRANDTVLRTNRGEIGLVVRDVATPEQADLVAARLARMASYPIYTDDGVLEARLTVGHLVLDAGPTEGSSALRQVCGVLNRARRSSGTTAAELAAVA
jgi:GGDEF domain-containing protein